MVPVMKYQIELSHLLVRDLYDKITPLNSGYIKNLTFTVAHASKAPCELWTQASKS